MVALTEIKQNLIPNDPDLADALALWRKDIFLQMNCHAVGSIESFDAITQTAKVSINYKRTYFQTDSNGNSTPVLKSYPVIVDAPVVALGGGGFSLTSPIAKGDECIVLFNDRDIDGWFAGSKNSPNPTSRLHSFSDAMILVGLRSLANVVVSYDTDGIALRNKTGTVKVKVKDDSVEIKAGDNTMIVKNDSSSLAFGNTKLTLDATKATIAVGTAITFEINSAGKLKFTNVSGEIIAALNSLLTTATAGGFPLILDPAALTIFQSFKA